MARTAIIAITTSSSMRVKPEREAACGPLERVKVVMDWKGGYTKRQREGTACLCITYKHTKTTLELPDVRPQSNSCLEPTTTCRE